MKIIHLLFGLLLCAFTAQAQNFSSLTNCATSWKNGVGITGATVGIGIETPGLPIPYIWIQMDSTQSCITTDFGNMPLDPDAKITVNGTKDDDPLNGITVLDLVMMSRHILGLEPFTSPYAMLAADVNRSGSITAFDIVEERKLLLGIYTNWPNSTDEWRFIPEYVQFPDPLNPFGSPPTHLYLTTAEFLAYDNDTLSLIGLKIGDVDGDANPISSGYQPSGSDSLFVILPDMTLEAGNTEVVIPVQISMPPQAINGIQFKFKFNIPGLSVVDILSGTAGVDQGNIGVFNDGVSVVIGSATNIPIVQGQAVFSLKLKYTSPDAAELKDAIEISQTTLPALAGTRTNAINKVYRLKQQFGETSSIFSPAVNTLRATPVTPNPFTDKAFIQVELTEATSVLLEVFDLAGRLRWSEEQTLPAGVQQLEIPGAAVDLGSMGFYRVRAGVGVATGKVSRE